MDTIESFEVTKGGASGDLLSEKLGPQSLIVGLLACGYFEYWRMYDNLRAEVAADMKRIADHLEQRHTLVYPGLVDTLDNANDAGLSFKENHIDLLVISEGTYCPDYFVHQALLHLPSDIPLCVFLSQTHDRLDFEAGYDQSLRNSGPMGLIQLTGGFRKMGKYPGYEVVVGSLEDEDSYVEIERIIQVHTTIRNLRTMTIGTVGHVFRGMYDFNFDKTDITGKLGPHVMDVNIDHVMAIHDEIEVTDERIASLVAKVKSSYAVSELSDDELARAAHLAVALRELVARYNLDGLVLLGQHLIEAHANATCYLGLAELLSTDAAIGTTEGDVIGCIMMKVLKDFSGHTPFFGEWEEIDVSLNAVMLLGHGFLDPREARNDRPVLLKSSSENWGFEGNSPGFEATYPPGPITLTHAIHDTSGWRLLISGGEVLDTKPLKINESYLIVRVEKPVKEYFRELARYGFSHHCIAAPGNHLDDLEIFARQLDLEVCLL